LHAEFERDGSSAAVIGVIGGSVSKPYSISDPELLPFLELRNKGNIPFGSEALGLHHLLTSNSKIAGQANKL
jgi:hypothetical protein